MEVDKAIILFGHGSRDPLWRQPIEAVATRLRSGDSSLAVRCAYLEFTAPDLNAAAGELIKAGARSITIIPMFLGVGKHAREDLPALVAQLKADFPAVVFKLQPAVGEDSRLLDLLARIALE